MEGASPLPLPPTSLGTHSLLQIRVPLPQGSWGKEGREEGDWSVCQQRRLDRGCTVVWKQEEWAEGHPLGAEGQESREPSPGQAWLVLGTQP